MRNPIQTPPRMVHETRTAAFRLLERASSALEKGNVVEAERLTADARALQAAIRR